MANIVPSCYRRPVGHLASVLRPGPLVAVVLLAPGVLASACSRTGFETSDVSTRSVGPEARDGSLGRADSSAPPPPEPTAPDGATPSAPPATPTAPTCTPVPETCNGLDDDCNGHVDDAIAPVPCNGGGNRYCVSGRFTTCPDRCDACVPGSERVCFHSYCTYWAVQACTADGKSFGACRERLVPAECASVADRYRESPELERCCIDNGYCCHDQFDLDQDGNRDEMLGTCDEVSCHP